MTIDLIMRMAPVIPVLVIDWEIDPVALAETLVEAGLPVIEVTLRTNGALASLRAMAAVKGAVVGAGTVLNDRMLNEGIDAGAKFIVSWCAEVVTRGAMRMRRANDQAIRAQPSPRVDQLRGLAMNQRRNHVQINQH